MFFGGSSPPPTTGALIPLCRPPAPVRQRNGTGSKAAVRKLLLDREIIGYPLNDFPYSKDLHWVPAQDPTLTGALRLKQCWNQPPVVTENIFSIIRFGARSAAKGFRTRIEAYVCGGADCVAS